jgi:hypothetical protein
MVIKYDEIFTNINSLSVNHIRSLDIRKPSLSQLYYIFLATVYAAYAILLPSDKILDAFATSLRATS